jgi:hypothetical protein
MDRHMKSFFPRMRLAHWPGMASLPANAGISTDNPFRARFQA